MTLPREPSAVALIMAEDLTRLGARLDDEAGCIMVLRGARWTPSVIDMHLDEARENARAGRGVNELRVAA